MIEFKATRHTPPGYVLTFNMHTGVGFLPSFLWDSDPRPAAEQINERYAYGGGWRSFRAGFKVRGDFDALVYPGSPEDGEPDEIYPALAEARLRDERIVLFLCDWVAIIQPDGSFDVARLD